MFNVRQRSHFSVGFTKRLHGQKKEAFLICVFSPTALGFTPSSTRMNPEKDYSDYKFETTSTIHNYRGNNLVYGMLCDTIILNHEWKEVNIIRDDHLVNLQNLTSNIEKI